MPPAPTASDQRFEVDEDGAVWLRASRCRECERFAFPAREYCPRCRRPSTDGVRIGHGAKLFSFTVCNTAPRGWRAPYLQAYVQLPEDIRVFTLIADEVAPAISSLAVGMEMEPVAEALHGESRRLTYKYRPIAPRTGEPDA